MSMEGQLYGFAPPRFCQEGRLPLLPPESAAPARFTILDLRHHGIDSAPFPLPGAQFRLVHFIARVNLGGGDRVQSTGHVKLSDEILP